MGKSHDYNIAADLGFWDNRFGLTFEHYWRYETDKITAAPSYLYPPSTGVDGNVPNMNFSKLKAWGWDLTLTHRNTVGKVKYNVDLTLAKSQDKYLDFGDESSVTPNLRRVGRSSMVWSMYEAEACSSRKKRLTTGRSIRTDRATPHWLPATSSTKTRTAITYSTLKT